MMLRFLLLLSFGACLAWANQPGPCPDGWTHEASNKQCRIAVRNKPDINYCGSVGATRDDAKGIWANYPGQYNYDCVKPETLALSQYSYMFRHVPNKTVKGGIMVTFAQNGNVLIMEGQTPDECAELCVANSQCKAFQLDQTGQCRMRNRSPDMDSLTTMEDNTRYDSYVMKPKDRIKYIKIEVSNQQNSESKDSVCVIKFPGGAVSAEFTQSGGSVFNKGQTMLFRVFGLDSLSKSGYILKAGLDLKCESASKDALHVNKVLIETEKAYYSGEVNNVFDDVDTCNTHGLNGLAHCGGKPPNKCCRPEVVVQMVSVPRSVFDG